MKREPKTLMEAIAHFSDPEVAFEAAKEFRFPNGVHCPTCGRADVRFIATRRMWECKEKHPRKQFSVKVGTIMEDSALGLDVWFAAIWTIANDKNGISSYEFARMAGVTQKSAWHVLHRVRLAMKVSGSDKMGGPGSEVEADETYVGGRIKNMHKAARAKRKVGVGGEGKAIVMGVLQRATQKTPSRVRAFMVPNTTTQTIDAGVRDNVEAGARVLTDAHSGYRGLNDAFVHEFVNHTVEYVRGTVHTNGIENFWSLLKRSLRGTYVSVEPRDTLTNRRSASMSASSRTASAFVGLRGRFLACA